MMNPYIIKKYGGLLFNSFISAIMFYVGFLFYGFWGGLIFLLFGIILGVIVASLMLRHPFTAIIEGKGILTLPVDSSGLITPFIMKVKLPFIEGKYRGQEISDVFNRNTVFNMQEAKKVDPDVEIKEDENGKKRVILSISEDEFNTGRFQLNQFPAFVYSLPLNSVITKEMLAEKESKYFAEHTIINLTRKVNELGKWIRDFARYAIEQMRPKKGLNVATAAMWLLIGLIIIMAIIFLPRLFAIMGGGSGTTTSAISNALGSVKTIVPQ